MNDQVHVDHPPGGAGHVAKDEPAVDQRQRVVDPVEVDQSSLAQNNEQRVNQFRCLGEGEEEVPAVDANVLNW